MKIIKIKEAMELTSLGRTKIWALERAGQFPKLVPIIGDRKGFLLSEVEAWIQDKADQRGVAA